MIKKLNTKQLTLIVKKLVNFVEIGEKNEEIIEHNKDKGERFTRFIASLYNFDDRSKTL